MRKENTWLKSLLRYFCETIESPTLQQKETMMPKYEWDKLNNLQIGAYAEYVVKMEFAMYGFEVYSSDVDDHGIDFIARVGGDPFIEVQVKSIRGQSGYVFMRKTKFEIKENIYLAFVHFLEGQHPTLYLIPSIRWQTPDKIFSDRSYEGQKSLPEWGLSISPKNIAELQKFDFEKTVHKILEKTPDR